MRAHHLLIVMSVFCILMSACQSSSQEPVRVSIELDDESTHEYMEWLPNNKPIGVLVLMPGFSQRAHDVFADTDLPTIAQENDLLVVTMNTGFNLTANEEISTIITKVLTDVLIRHEFDQEQFIFGGFSAGGSVLLRYAELCLETPGDYPVVPAAVFTVDSPLDIISFFTYCERELARNFSDVGMNEARHIKNMLEAKYGVLGEHRATYEQLTAIDISSMNSGNERHLYRTPVRVYHDVDIPWIIESRRRSALDANFLASSELISRLRVLGNERAEFIQSAIPGMRNDGRRHPHSWNIVDGKECIAWMLKIFNQ